MCENNSDTLETLIPMTYNVYTFILAFNANWYIMGIHGILWDILPQTTSYDDEMG